jgi:hypothetical protein
MISGNNGATYAVLESYEITGVYETYDLLIDVSGTYNTNQGRIKIEMTAGTNSTRLRDFSIEEYEIVPTLTLTPGSLSGFSYMEGSGPSASQSFVLSGMHLSGGNVIVGAPSGYEVSLNNSTFASSRTLTAYNGNPVTLYVRLRAGLEAGTYSSRRITAAGGDANPVYVSLSGQVIAPSPGLPYAQTFGGFTELSNLPSEWSLDKDNYNYGGDFGAGTSGGLRGNGALGFQLTASAPNNTFASTLTVQNNTGSTLTELAIAYTGKVARVTETGTPKWVVSVNGTEYSQLEYSTADGTDKRVSHTITGLSIPNGGLIEIAWSTTSAGTTGTRRQIGIADVQIGEQFTGPQIIASPTSVSGLTYGLNYGPSLAKTVLINGINLAPAQGQLNLTAPSAFQVSLDNIVFRSQISLPYTEESLSTTVYVRMREGLAAGGHSGNISVSGGGASTLQLNVSGIVIGPPGLPYAQDFSGFVYPVNTVPPYFGNNFEWTFASSGTLGSYLGDWGSGTSGGFRGNSEVLGYQHTSGTGTMTALLTLKNDSDISVYKMRVAYTGKVAREAEGRSPEWKVSVNGVEVPELAYSTLEGTDQHKEVTLSGLNIPPGAYFTISWESSRGDQSGSSKQIGISDVEVEAIDVTVPVTFIVSDGVNPIQGASILVGGYQLQTNIQGVAVANLPPGDFLYDVTAYTYEPIEGESLTVGEVPLEVPVVLAEEAFFVLTLPWNEDFDLGFPARGWRRYQLGASAQGIQWTESDDAYSGSRAAWHKYTGRTERADSWLVSPPIALPADELIHMSFVEKNRYMASYYTYSGVWISTGGGAPSSGEFIEIHESSTAYNAYTKVSLDLSAYAGDTIYLAFVYRGAYGHDWWVDDVSLTSSIPSYVVELTADPDGAGSVSGGGEYTRGEQLTIAAEAEAAYYFAGWYDTYGNLFSDSENYTFMMPDHALNLTARFEMKTFTLQASASQGGSVNPSGTIHVAYGDTQSFDIVAEEGYEILSVMVDGVNIGQVHEYTFANIQANHTIAVEFEWIHYTITTVSTIGGSLLPGGNVSVPYLGTQTIDIVPDAGYVIGEVYVDDVAVGAVESYTFEGVTSDHDIFVIFEPISFVITAMAEVGGSITPEGEVGVTYGGSQLFAITPAVGHHIEDVLVDGESVGAVSEYTFNGVMDDHSIVASFARNTYTITSTATQGGSISPLGETQVLYGGRQTYMIIPQPGFSIVYVEVNGVRKGSPASYTFESVNRDHHIHARFSKAYYELTLNATPQEGGSVIGRGHYALGGSVMVYARANNGYRFEKWTNESGEVVSTSAVYRFTMPARAMELTAHFVPEGYQLTLIARPEHGGIAYGAGSYAQGSVVEIEAVANAGYAFVNWTVPGGMVISEEAAFTYIMPPLNIEMRANFIEAGKTETQADTSGWKEIPTSGGVDLPLLSLKLFPNPASATLYIESSETISHLRVLDISGRVLYAAAVDNYSYQLNVSGMKTGLYFVQLLSSAGWSTERVQVINQ